jgi:2-keto-4-pentenoate hydratase/2-oxohepta-3-ene-1,7-dioic acid hydratase in catechol pathway
MRLARAGIQGEERPIVSIDEETWLDLSPVTADIDRAFLRDGIDRARTLAVAGLLAGVPEPSRFGPPIASSGKVVCIGLNYRDHAEETGAEIPSEPIVFMKSAATLIGPDDSVLIPRRSTKTDWEVELAIVIGSEARYLSSPAKARDVIAGYAISNDVSEREFQLEHGGQWDKGKNCETFNPLGPWIRTADEVTTPQQLGLRLWVNGEQQQGGSTANMIFGIDHVIWYLSQFMVLEPGDIINTGTPAGVALGRAVPNYLREGDVMELEIDGLGRQRQTVGQA